MVKPLVASRHPSVAERIQLVEGIQDSIAEHPEAVQRPDTSLDLPRV